MRTSAGTYEQRYNPEEPEREERPDSENINDATQLMSLSGKIKRGCVSTFVTSDRLDVQFAWAAVRFMQYPDVTTIRLVMDNLNIHRRKSLTDMRAVRPAGRSGTDLRPNTRPPTEAG
jgi:hypothetical protein